MSQPFFTNEDYFLILQWIAILIPILFVGLRTMFENESIEKDDFVFSYTFIIIMVASNAIIGYSVYEDCLFFYDVFMGENGEKYNNRSILFFLNFSPVVGIARLLSILSMIIYYASSDDSKIAWKIFGSLLIIFNIIIGLPSIVLALF